MVSFIKQAAAVYPENADVSRQLIFLGDTIGKGVREAKQRERLLQIGSAAQTGGLQAATQTAFNEGLLKEALTMQGMLEQQRNRAADEAWRREQAEVQQRQWAAGHGLSAAQLKIAQDAATQNRLQGDMKLKLLQDVLGQQPSAAPAQAPQGGGLLPVPNAQPASFSERFSAPVAGPSAGVPRDELALSMLGYGDAAKAMREARKSTPEAILADTRAKKSAEETVSTELQRPTAEAKASEAIEGVFKAGQEALRLASHPGLSAAAGPVASKIPTVRGQTANFETDLETLGTKIFITTINRMRELSKTGGAVGSVTEKEMAKLENSLRNLSLRQDPANLKTNLVAVAQDFNDSMANIAKAYEAQYGKPLKYEPLKIPKQAGEAKPVWSWE